MKTYAIKERLFLYGMILFLLVLDAGPDLSHFDIFYQI
jgi:hypothetical protein